MSRIARITFLVIVASAVIIVAGFDLRLAVASRNLADETAAALDQHERHPDGIGVVTTASALDEHERRAASAISATVTSQVQTALDEHERRAASQAASVGTTSVPAALDEHERRTNSNVPANYLPFVP